MFRSRSTRYIIPTDDAHQVRLKSSFKYRQSNYFLYRLKMGSVHSLVLFTRNVKKIKGAAHKNGDFGKQTPSHSVMLIDSDRKIEIPDICLIFVTFISAHSLSSTPPPPPNTLLYYNRTSFLFDCYLSNEYII